MNNSWSVRRIAALGLVVFFALVAIQALYLYRYSIETRESRRWVMHTHEVITELESLFSKLKDAESAQRGYVITGVEDYLVPYKNALNGEAAPEDIGPNERADHQSLKTSLGNLRRLMKDNPNQLERLNALEQTVAKKTAFMVGTVETRRTEGFEAAIASIRTQKGKQLMDEIRQQISDLVREEELLLAGRNRDDRQMRTHFVTFTTVTLSAAYFGLLVALLLVLRNFYQARRNEEERIASDEKFRVLFEHSTDAHFMFDEVDGILDCNPALLRMLNCTDKSLVLGRHPAMLSPEFQPDGERSLAKTAAIDGATRRDGFMRFEWLMRKMTGEEFPIEVTLTPVKLNGREVILGVWHDLTERKQYEEKIKISEARFERAVRGSNDGIWDWNLATNEVFYSQRFKELLGYTEDEFPNLLDSWAARLHPDDYQPTMNRIDEHLKKNVPYVVEYRIRRKSGDYLWVEARGQAQWNAQGQPVQMSGSLINISDKKRIEELKHEFVYTVTHELRTPLTALKGAIDVLQHLLQKDMPQRVANMIDIAIRGSDRLMMLINDLLDIGKLEAGQMQFSMQKIHLAKLLRESIALNAPYGDQYKVSFDLHEPVDDPKIYIDPDRFMQVMANLLSNAAKFSPEGGHVVIATAPSSDKIRISVSDKGAGIPEHLQKRIFQKFAQGDSERGGTGLGLNITKTIVERMHGLIGFDTVPGQGTTFYVEFPITA